MWYDLLLMAGDSRNPGVIEATENHPYPPELIANWLLVPVELLNRTIQKCVDTGRINVNKGGIHIINWDKYQSEYERQKPYRDAKKSGKRTYKLCRNCGYKALTAEIFCPKCDIRLETDYTGGEYGHMVNQ